MRYCLLLLLMALAAPLCAELIEVKALTEPATAKRGGEVKLRVQFTVVEGYHAYHKDNHGYSKPLKVEITELSGLTQVGETIWPKYHEHIDASDPTWIEYELAGVFELVYTFTVPAKAGDSLRIEGKFEAQVCDADGCQDKQGTFSADIKVETGTANEEPKPPVSGATSEEIAALKKELAEVRKASEDISKTLKDFIKGQQEKAAASGALDEHGFYEDYDFALGEAKKQGKLLLIDFNGEY